MAGSCPGDRVGRLVCCHAELRELLHPRQQHSLPGVMPSYTVTVATGSQWFAGTDDYIYLSLIGSAGCSEKHLLDKAFYNDFERGAVRTRARDRDRRDGGKAGWGGGSGGDAGDRDAGGKEPEAGGRDRACRRLRTV